nr:cryptochrome/photolyase family protein [Micromonospora tarapacensis]
MVDGDEPAGGRWSFDSDNRQPPPKGVDRLDVPPPPMPREDEIDAEVRADLDRWEREGIRFVGRDGPRRFPVITREAQARLRHFLKHRLPRFGPYEDAMLAGDPWLAHSLLSSSFNLGLLDPMAAVRGAEQAYRRHGAPLPSVEGFIRQILGWRDFVWHLDWYFEPGYQRRRLLGVPVPQPGADPGQRPDGPHHGPARPARRHRRGTRPGGKALRQPTVTSVSRPRARRRPAGGRVAARNAGRTPGR